MADKDLSQFPLGTTDFDVFMKNVENEDKFVNSEEHHFEDRKHKNRYTLAGLENLVETVAVDGEERITQAIINAGYQFLGDYAAGIVVTEYNQVIRDADGELWAPFATTELPYTTTGAGMPEGGAFKAVGDAALRSELSEPGGVLLVNGAVIYVLSVTDLLAIENPFDGLIAIVTNSNQSGEFRYTTGNFSDFIAQDPSMSLYAPSSTANSGAWVRQNQDPFYAKWTNSNDLDLIPDFIFGEIYLNNEDYQGSYNSVNRVDRYFKSSKQATINSIQISRTRDLGLIKKPMGFDWDPPVSVYKDKNRYEVVFDGDYYDKASRGSDTIIYYVNAITGEDSSSRDGLTAATALKSIDRALARAIQADIDNCVIYVSRGIYKENYGWGNQNYTGNLSVIGEDGVFITTATKIESVDNYENIYIVNLDPTQSISTNLGVVDTKVMDEFGRYMAYKPALNIQEVLATPGSYLRMPNLTSAYVHTLDGAPIDDSLLFLRNYSNGKHKAVNKSLYVKNMSFIGGQGGSFTTSTGANGVSVFENVEFSMCSDGDGLRAHNVGLVISINCSAYNNWRDGFNYHDYDGVGLKALEINCNGWRNGYHKTSSHPQNSNASSAHESSVICRINVNGWENRGPNIIDIDNCKSWNIGCKGWDSIAFGGAEMCDFSFSGIGARAWLEGCSGGLSGTQIKQSDGSQVKVKDWEGGFMSSGAIDSY